MLAAKTFDCNQELVDGNPYGRKRLQNRNINKRKIILKNVPFREKYFATRK